jgi:hypothetical protein
VTNQGNEFALAFNLQTQDAKAIVGIMKRNTFNKPLKAI